MKIVHILCSSLVLVLPVVHGSLRHHSSRELNDGDPVVNNCPWCNVDRTLCIPRTDVIGKFTCICRDGYTEPPGCRDLNECEESDPKPCAFDGGVCVDMDGTYKCVCDTNSGFVDGPLREDGLGVLYCSTADENCGGKGACHPNASCINNADCTCKPSFEGDGVLSCTEVVVDVPDVPTTPAPVAVTPGVMPAPLNTGGNGANCAGNPCDPTNSFCDSAVNLCRCLPGWVAPAGLGGTCQDENECDAGINDCDQRVDAEGNKRSICTNISPSLGSWECACNLGWTTAAGEEEGKVCIDEDECTTGTHNCVPVTEMCINRVPPARFQCYPATPAPTSAPTPAPTIQQCSLEIAVNCLVPSDTGELVACNTIGTCQDCAPSKMCFTYTEDIACSTTTNPTALVSCVAGPGSFSATGMSYTIVDPVSSTSYGSGALTSGTEICAENAGGAFPSKLVFTLSNAGAAVVQTVTMHSDCTTRPVVFGDVFGALTFKSYISSCRGAWPPTANSLSASITYDAINRDKNRMRIERFERFVNSTTSANNLDLLDLTGGITTGLYLYTQRNRFYTRAETEDTGSGAGVMVFDLTMATNITLSADASAVRRSNCTQTLLYQVPDIKA